MQDQCVGATRGVKIALRRTFDDLFPVRSRDRGQDSSPAPAGLVIALWALALGLAWWLAGGLLHDGSTIQSTIHSTSRWTQQALQVERRQPDVALRDEPDDLPRPLVLWPALASTMVDTFWIGGIQGAVPLNIKNADVEHLVDEVARLAGESKTEAVRRALEERRERLAFRVVQQDRAGRLREFLEQHVWPRVPRGQLGRRLSRRQEETLLGYGPRGV
jgi:antitoxin VapB